MSLITWDESYAVKVRSCDDDHKKLFALINDLHDAMKSGKGAQIVGKVIQELAHYTKYHFTREEGLLEKAEYPGLAAHRIQHREFVKKIEQFHKDCEKGVTGQSIAVTGFLRDWLSKHIKQTDRQYSEHLNARGIS